MRILHVITSLRTGGAEHLMVDLLPRLRDLGNEVELLLFDGIKTSFYHQLQQKGITIHSLGEGGNVYRLGNIFKLIRFIGKYDIIHTHNTACQLFVPIARALSHSNVKLVTTEHSATNRRRGKWYLKPIEKWLYNRYSYIICISDQPAENLRKHIGAKDSIVVVNNGVDVTKFLYPIKDVSKKESFLITQVSSFNDAKDQDTLIRAMTKLPDNYRLQLAGDGARRPKVEELTRDLGVSNRVDFLGIRTDVPKLLQESDINVLSSHWEGLSLSSIEGMASGRPFIASDVDGLREIVKDNGILFPHGDYKALALAIRELCENPQYYHDVAERCQAKAKQYDISVMANNYNELYKSL